MERIRKIHGMLKGVGDVDLIRFMATCEYQTGLTSKKVREYLGVLENIGFVEVDEDLNLVRDVMKA